MNNTVKHKDHVLPSSMSHFQGTRATRTSHFDVTFHSLNVKPLTLRYSNEAVSNALFFSHVKPSGAFKNIPTSTNHNVNYNYVTCRMHAQPTMQNIYNSPSNLRPLSVYTTGGVIQFLEYNECAESICEQYDSILCCYTFPSAFSNVFEAKSEILKVTNALRSFCGCEEDKRPLQSRCTPFSNHFIQKCAKCSIRNAYAFSYYTRPSGCKSRCYPQEKVENVSFPAESSVFNPFSVTDTFNLIAKAIEDAILFKDYVHVSYPIDSNGLDHYNTNYYYRSGSPRAQQPTCGSNFGASQRLDDRFNVMIRLDHAEELFNVLTCLMLVNKQFYAYFEKSLIWQTIYMSAMSLDATKFFALGDIKEDYKTHYQHSTVHKASKIHCIFDYNLMPQNKTFSTLSDLFLTICNVWINRHTPSLNSPNEVILSDKDHLSLLSKDTMPLCSYDSAYREVYPTQKAYKTHVLDKYSNLRRIETIVNSYGIYRKLMVAMALESKMGFRRYIGRLSDAFYKERLTYIQGLLRAFKGLVRELQATVPIDDVTYNDTYDIIITIETNVGHLASKICPNSNETHYNKRKQPSWHSSSAENDTQQLKKRRL